MFLILLGEFFMEQYSDVTGITISFFFKVEINAVGRHLCTHVLVIVCLTIIDFFALSAQCSVKV